MNYEHTYDDWKYLFKTIGSADDMTGGYVDSEDLDLLLKSPDKRTATRCLSRQVEYWFYSGLEYSTEHTGKSIYELIVEYPRLGCIVESWCIELRDCPNPFCRINY